MTVINSNTHRTRAALTMMLAGLLTALVIGGALWLFEIEPRPLAVGIACALLAWLLTVPLVLMFLEDMGRRRA